MNYALGCSFNLQLIFANFDIKRIKTNWKILEKTLGTASKKAACAKIFASHVKMVLEDVINNDVTFLLPTGSRKSDIHMILISDEEFLKARSRGKFLDVDFLQSNFTGYQLGLFLYGKIRTRIKHIYVQKDLKLQITNKTNEGHLYA